MKYSAYIWIDLAAFLLTANIIYESIYAPKTKFRKLHKKLFEQVFSSVQKYQFQTLHVAACYAYIWERIHSERADKVKQINVEKDEESKTITIIKLVV